MALRTNPELAQLKVRLANGVSVSELLFALKFRVNVVPVGVVLGAVTVREGVGGLITEVVVISGVAVSPAVMT